MDWDVFEYRFVPDLWVITPYYNPAGYRTRRANYEIFARLLRQSGIPLLTDEKWLLKNGHTYKREVLDRNGRTISSQHLSK